MKIHKISDENKNLFPKYFYWSIPIFLISNIIFRSFYYEGTATTDSFSYFKLAASLPKIKSSYFPILYPFLLKITNLFTNDYFISSKILSIISILFILYFTKKVNFFWKEIWILLLSPICFMIMPMSWSETVLLPILIVYFYLNYIFINKKVIPSKFIIYNSILLFLLLLTKYSCISFMFANSMFILYLLYKKKSKIATDLFYCLLFSSILISIYLFINFLLTGHLTGAERVAPIRNKMNIILSFYQSLYSLNPFFGRDLFNIKINYNLAAIFSIIFFIFWLYLFFKAKSLKKIETNQILFFSIISFIFVLISYFNTKLDTLGPRLLFPSTISFYIAIIYTINNLKMYKLYKDKILIFIGIYFLLSGFLNKQNFEILYSIFDK